MSEYDSYDYSYEREKRIREEERKRREEERIRREQQQKKRQVKENKKQIEILLELLDGLMSSELVEFLEKAKIDEMEREVGNLEKKNNLSESMSALQALDGKLKELSSSCSKIENQAQRRLAEHRFRLEQERKKKDALIGLDAARKLAKGLGEEEDSRFIKRELTDVHILIEECSRQISESKFDDSLHLVQQLEDLCEGAVQMLRTKKGLSEKFRIVAEGLTELEIDPVYKTWAGSQIASLRMQISQFQRQLAPVQNLQSAGYETKLAHIKRDIDNLIKTAERKQEDELIRRDVTSALIEAMKEEGFTVSAPVLEGDQESDVVLTGRKPGRVREQRVSLKIGLLGQIFMDVDAGDPGDLARVREAKVDKSKEKDVACRKIATQLKAVLGKKGVNLDRKKVQWHNPDRIARGAKELPKGSPAQRRL